MRLYKIKRAVNFFGYIVAGSVIILTIFPHFFFGNTYDYKSFKVYSTVKLDGGIKDVLDKSEGLLCQSEIYDQSHKQKIFFCNNTILFSAFALFSYDAFAVNNPITSNIFIANGDIQNNISHRAAKDNNTRSLSGVIAHEVCHSLLKIELGFIKNKFLSTWKNEGYCDFIAQESSFQNTEGINQICSKNNNQKNKSFTYFKYRQYIDYLINQKNKSILTIVDENYNIDLLDINIYKRLCMQLDDEN